MDFNTEVLKYKDDFLKDLNTLVSYESVRDESTKAENAPFGKNCRDVLDAMLDMAKRDGFETKDIDGYAGVVEYGQGEETFGVLGHLDIVPLGEGWTKDPLKVTLENGYIFGRGVMDDKGPALAGYYALKMIRDLNIPLKKRVMLITGCDEESGMECMNYYVDHAEVPQMGFVPDANFPVIYGEKGGLHVGLVSSDATVIKKLHAGSRPNIVIGKADVTVDVMSYQQEDLFKFYCATQGVKGSIKRSEDGVTLHIDGAFAHAAMPYNGVNAAVLLLNFIGEAYNDQLSKDLYFLLKDWMGKPVGIEKDGLYMSFLTMNTGIVNMENNETDILIDIRYPNDTNADEIMSKFDATCANLTSNIKAENRGDSTPLFVDPDSRLVKDLMSVYQKYTADAFVGGCHQRDEGIKLDNLLQAICIYADAIVALCS